jgi:hypothetical protein
MALVDLWNSDRNQVTEKRIDQLIAFAGDGKLRDGNSTSLELRALLGVVPSDVLGQWIDQCLEQRFPDFGFVLQDIVNEIGRRLNFDVTHGVYRGRSEEGLDGLWILTGKCGIVVESKSSTDYKINLTRIAEYRTQVSPSHGLSIDQLSILIVVGSEDTEELEAQVRGSKFAWNVRLLGMHSLFRLLQLKESLDDPAVERQIQEILIPQEFTRLDRIVDLVFATVEDAQQPESALAEEPDEVEQDLPSHRIVVPVKFHSKVILRVEKQLGEPLVKKSRVLWTTADGQKLLSCQVSKEYSRRFVHYWFGLKSTTKSQLESASDAYCVFGLGSPDVVVMMPYPRLAEYLDDFFTSPDSTGGIMHWHVRFENDAGRILLMTNRDQGRVDVTAYLLK